MEKIHVLTTVQNMDFLF